MSVDTGTADRYAIWKTRQRKRARFAALWVGVGVLSLLGFVIGTAMMMRFVGQVAGTPGAQVPSALTVVPVIVVTIAFLPPVIIFGRQWWREIRLADLVPKHEGLVCPRCCRALHAEEEIARCARCKSPWPRDELATYWDQYLLPKREVGAWCQEFIQRYRPGGPSRPFRFFTAVRSRPLYIFLWVVGCFVVVGVPYALLTSTSVVSSLRSFAPMVVFMTGLLLVLNSVSGRRGGSRHCAKCDYERRPESGARCPECGADWDQPGGTIHGRRGRTSGRLAVGIGLIVLFLAGQAVSMVRGPGWFLQSLPTPILIGQIVGTRGFCADEWAELGTRTLTREQELRLARGLLDKRERKSYLSQAGDAWLVAAAQQPGRLPPDLVDRFYREMIGVEGVTPARATAGQPVTLSVRLASRIPLWQNETVYLFIEEIRVDGVPQGTRSEQAVSIWDMAEEGFRQRRHTDAALTLTPGKAGPLRVQLKLRHWYAPTGQGLVDRAEDGTPIEPTGTLWSGQVVIDHVLKVE